MHMDDIAKRAKIPVERIRTAIRSHIQRKGKKDSDFSLSKTGIVDLTKRDKPKQAAKKKQVNKASATAKKKKQPAKSAAAPKKKKQPSKPPQAAQEKPPEVATPLSPAARQKRHNDLVREELRQYLYGMNSTDFEDLVCRLLEKMGFKDCRVTNQQNDHGIDVYGTLVVVDTLRVKVAVQAKRWGQTQNVTPITVRQVRGSLAQGEHGLIITTGNLSPQAPAEAIREGRQSLGLVDGEKLVELLIEHGIGVHDSGVGHLVLRPDEFK